MNVPARSSDRLVLDLVLARRAVDLIQLAVLVLLIVVYLVGRRPVDATSGLQPVPIVMGLFIFATGMRMLLAYLGREVAALRLVWPVLDMALLHLLLAVYAWQYQLPPTAILKATTADAVFLLIALRTIQFDTRVVVTTGAAAAIGWIVLSAYAVHAAGPGSVTHSFAEYMTSEKALIGAQIERILMIILVSLVITCALVLARRDAQSGLGNRTWFLSRLIERTQAMGASPRMPVLVLIEIDCGHGMRAAGGYELTQQIVRRVGRQLAKVSGRRNLLARTGDCTFAILTSDLDNREAAEAFAAHCLAVVEASSDVDGRSVKGRAAVGVVLAEGEADPTTLWHNAQAALGAAMSGRYGRLVVFDEAARREAEHRIRLETELHSAQHLGQLELHYQPIVRVSDQSLVGIEALMRWHHPQLGLVPPGLFIPIAEETGLIVEMGVWAINQVAADQKRLVQAGAPNDIVMSVNVAPRQLEQWTALEAAVRSAVDGGCPLKLELTESAMGTNIDLVHERLSKLASAGARLAIDDFGTGYSSYAHLMRMPFHTLKIDRSFTIGVLDPAGRAVVGGIVSLAQSLGLSVTAEGVETAEQQAALSALGVDDFQGYLFSKPVPLAGMIAGLPPDRTGGEEIAARAA